MTAATGWTWSGPTPEEQRELEERHLREEYERTEQARTRALDLLGRAIPPRAFAVATSIDREETDAVAQLRAAPAVLTVLSGPTGVGKTAAVASVLVDHVRVMARPQDLLAPHAAVFVLWVSAPELARWQRYDEREMARLLGARRLVIDDLGTEFLDEKGSFRSLFDEVIDSRYQHSRPTYITTNVGAETFRARYGERIVDRLREAGRFVAVGGPSLRGRRT